MLPLIPYTGAVSRYFALARVIQKQKVGYFQTIILFPKYNCVILVSFVFKLSGSAVVGGGGRVAGRENQIDIISNNDEK